MTDNLFDDPNYADAAILGSLEGELRRMGWRFADQLSEITTRLMERIEALESAPKLVETRVSEIKPGDVWLLDAGWVTVTAVNVNHPDNRVTITYYQDGDETDTTTTSIYRGFEVAVVKREQS